MSRIEERAELYGVAIDFLPARNVSGEHSRLIDLVEREQSEEAEEPDG